MSSRRSPFSSSFRACAICLGDSFGGGPGRTPRSRAAFMPSRVRSIISPRSNSAFCSSPQNAEFERDILHDRVKAGIAQARKEGRLHGRPPTVRKHAGEIETLFADGVSKRQIAARLSISRASVRRMLALRRSVLRRSRPGVRERRANKS